MDKTLEFKILHRTPLVFIKNHPACSARFWINDTLVEARFVIDTGADMSILPSYFIEGIDLEGKVAIDNYDCGGLGGSLQGKIVTADVLIVANYSVNKPYIFIPSDPNWSIPILGFDMLRGVYPFIDTKEKFVWFTRIKNAGTSGIPSIGLELKCDVFVVEGNATKDLEVSSVFVKK